MLFHKQLLIWVSSAFQSAYLEPVDWGGGGVIGVMILFSSQEKDLNNIRPLCIIAPINTNGRNGKHIGNNKKFGWILSLNSIAPRKHISGIK